ncbi:MAG: hypothetical protein H7263_05060 [Candidatus Sericytochromatia bacterium]|nr:hypothetical protein [Candidatus Sericytochromatia bacterium]
MKNMITVALLTTMLYGCANAPTIIITSPTPSPTANTNNVIKYKYDLPIKFSVKDECSNNSKDLYQIKDGNFSYNLNEDVFSGLNTENDLHTEKISQGDSDGLKRLLNENDISSSADQDIKLPTDGPQTTECRAIDSLTVNVNGKDTVFARNDRNVRHNQKYLDSFNNIKNKLIELRSKFVKNVDLNKEFDLKIGQYIKFDGENTLKLDSITQESRCPSDVQCIQAGQASFKFKLDQKFIASTEFELTSRAGMDSLAIKKVNDYTFTLTKVLPEGFKALEAPKLSDYIVTLKIEKK